MCCSIHVLVSPAAAADIHKVVQEAYQNDRDALVHHRGGFDHEALL